MDTVQDFEDILDLFDQHAVRYLIIGGLAFTYHAKPPTRRTSTSGSTLIRKTYSE